MAADRHHEPGDGVIHHGDCIEVMAGMESESVDAIVTDPPYGLEFMGKEWDRLAAIPDRGPGPRGRNPYGGWHGTASGNPGGMQAFHARWAEAAYRVAKPSAYLLAFGGTRTVHRMTVALEDAGWIIRDMLVWGYASGFPKSKASLKPAWEPIVMARKPGPLRELAIDACRIGTEGATTRSHQADYGESGWRTGHDIIPVEGGRWPANVILTATEDGRAIFDGGIEGVVGGGTTTSGDPSGSMRNDLGWFGNGSQPMELSGYGDSGTYSRFFLIPKADRADREPVLGGLPLRDAGAYEGNADVGGNRKIGARSDLPVSQRANHHPTVKPTELMRHLVRLVTPVGGVVLDPFLGSGTTALAAEMEGFPWIGIEREAEYVAIAEARLNGTQRGLGLETA